MISHDERHGLLDELDLLRSRRAELEASLAVDDHPHDMGEQSEATLRRDELTWIDRRIRDIKHLLDCAARAGNGLPDRVCVGSVVTLRYPDGESERLKVTRIPDDDFPTATPESPLGRALLGARIGDEIEWAASGCVARGMATRVTTAGRCSDPRVYSGTVAAGGARPAGR